MTNYCTHLKQAADAKANNVTAKEFLVTKEKIKSLKLDKDDLAVLGEASVNGLIPVYILPDNNLAVPALGDKSHENPLDYLHIRDLKCPLQKCREKRAKLHTLIHKEGPICLHTLLGTCTLDPVESLKDTSAKKKPVPKLDRDSTVRYIVNNIQNHFPTMSQDKSAFLVRNCKYVQYLMQAENISKEIEKHVPTECPSCPGSQLLDWPYPAKKAFFVSLGAFKEIKLDLKTCSDCRTGYYPDLFAQGLIPLHNKFLLSYDLLFDLNNLNVTGSSLIDIIEAKYLLLGMCHGQKEENLKVNLSNNAKMIEKIVIATSSTLSEHE